MGRTGEPGGRWRWLALLGLLAAGAWLRFEALGAKCLWLDEALRWRSLNFPFAEMLRRVNDPAGDNPPLYFVLLWPWRAAWGDSEYALRSLAALCGTLTVGGMYLFVRELASLRPLRAGAPREGTASPALLAAALVAFNVLQIDGSRQVAMYSLGAALFVWASWLLLRASRPGGGGRIAWPLYGALALAFCYTHHLAPFFVFMQGLFVLALWLAAWRAGRPEDRPSGGQLRWALAAAAALAVGYFPAGLKLLAKSGQVARGSWQPAPTLHRVTAETAGTFLTVGDALRVVPAWLACGLTALLVALLLAVAVRERRAGWYLLLTGLGAPLLMLGYSLHTGRSLFLGRYLTFAQLPWLAAVAFALTRLPRLARWPVFGLLPLAAFYCLAQNWEQLGPAAVGGMRAAVGHVLRQRGPDEPVLVQGPLALPQVLYYGRGRLRPLLCCTIPSRHLQAQPAHLTDEDLIAHHRLLARDCAGAWFLYSPSYGEPGQLRFPTPDAWQLREANHFPQDRFFEGPVHVQHYRSPGPEALPASDGKRLRAGDFGPPGRRCRKRCSSGAKCGAVSGCRELSGRTGNAQGP
jgi:hypothetical protein